jgi:hypothetical protein
MEAKDRLPKPSLQTLPRELRDSIYDFVVATGECIVLGRRMVELHKENSDWTIDGYFDETVALHPLSMTCRQFRDEFTNEHLSGSEAPYVLLVNNFDLDQLHMFSEYIVGGYSIVVSTAYDDEYDPCDFPDYDPDVKLRFQLDDDTLRSACKLCQHVYFEGDAKGAAPEDLADPNARWKVLSVAEIVPQYVPRTTAVRTNRRSMTCKEAWNVDAQSSERQDRRHPQLRFQRPQRTLRPQTL